MSTKRKAAESAADEPGKRAHLGGNEAFGDLDMESQALRREKTRHGRVVTAGYDSEDDDDDEPSHRRGWKDTPHNEDDDMFAENPPNESKEPRYLKLADIDGQEFGAGTRLDDDDDENDLDNEEDLEYELERAEKDTRFQDANADAERTPPGSPGGDNPRTGVKKQGMGFRLDKFNMKAEMAGGQFDEEGNYVRNKRDPFAQNDRWLEGNYSRKQIKAASEAQRRREHAEQEREKQEQSEFPTMEHAMRPLAELMEPGESVLDTLQRLGAAAKRSGANGGTQERTAFEQLTQLSSVLMTSFGQMNVYDEMYEGLVRMVRRAGLVPEDWDPARQQAQKQPKEPPAPPEETPDSRLTVDVTFEYKWTPAYLAATAKAQGTAVDPETKTFGPFSASELRAWAAQGYFGSQKEHISVRSARDAPWTSWQDAGL